MAKNPLKPCLISENSNVDSFLQEPGDYVTAKVTKTNRKVMVASNRLGKRSITKYPNGSTVETLSYKN